MIRWERERERGRKEGCGTLGGPSNFETQKTKKSRERTKGKCTPLRHTINL
jgi:hypothetical protein